MSREEDEAAGGHFQERHYQMLEMCLVFVSDARGIHDVGLSFSWLIFGGALSSSRGLCSGWVVLQCGLRGVRKWGAKGDADWVVRLALIGVGEGSRMAWEGAIPDA